MLGAKAENHNPSGSCRANSLRTLTKVNPADSRQRHCLPCVKPRQRAAAEISKETRTVDRQQAWQYANQGPPDKVGDRVLKFGIVAVPVQRARSLAIAVGTRQPAKDEPTVWFPTVTAMARTHRLRTLPAWPLLKRKSRRRHQRLKLLQRQRPAEEVALIGVAAQARQEVALRRSGLRHLRVAPGFAAAG